MDERVRDGFFHICLCVVLVTPFLVLVWLGVSRMQYAAKACEDRGGVYVKVARGSYRCIDARQLRME